MLGKLWTLLKVIPSLITALFSVTGAIRDAIESYKRAKEEKRIQEGRELARQIEEAKSDEERKALLKKLSDRGL